MADKPPCGGCYFFGWLRLIRCCFQPETARRLDLAPAKCKHLVAVDQKAHPVKWWPDRLTEEQFQERENP